MNSFFSLNITNLSPISQFLREIKWRFFYCFLSFSITFYTCYIYSPDLFFWITKPCHQCQTGFLFLSLPEAFYTTLTLCSILTLCFCLPVIWYQWWSFFIPSLTQTERSKTLAVSFVFFILYLVSLSLTFYIITPLLLNFLLQFQIEQPSFSIQYQATLAVYISWIRSCLLSTFFVCQWPTILYICVLLNKITPKKLTDYRKSILLLCVFLGATISPPEILLQLTFTLIFWVYTECVFWLLFISVYKEK